jgi:predicted P-loop ATPase
VIPRRTGSFYYRLIEAAELHGNRGREAEQLKSFLSRQVDGPVRLAYGRLPTTVPRQFVIIGSTNSRLAYLKDHTGGRRFRPVAVTRFDVEALMADRDQLFAEAAAREAAGASIRLSPTLWTAAGEQQERRRAEDPWEPILEPLLDGDGMVDVEHVAVEAIWDKLKVEANHRDNRHADRVAAIVQRYGFTAKIRKRVDGGDPIWWTTSRRCVGCERMRRASTYDFGPFRARSERVQSRIPVFPFCSERSDRSEHSRMYGESGAGRRRGMCRVLCTLGTV